MTRINTAYLLLNPLMDYRSHDCEFPDSFRTNHRPHSIIIDLLNNNPRKLCYIDLLLAIALPFLKEETCTCDKNFLIIKSNDKKNNCSVSDKIITIPSVKLKENEIGRELFCSLYCLKKSFLLICTL